MFSQTVSWLSVTRQPPSYGYILNHESPMNLITLAVRGAGPSRPIAAMPLVAVAINQLLLERLSSSKSRKFLEFLGRSVSRLRVRDYGRVALGVNPQRSYSSRRADSTHLARHLVTSPRR